jgi:outer membrane lipoprotein-sorting protein
MLALLAAAGNADERKHPLEPALRIAARSQSALKDVDGYSAVFEKKELVGRRLISSTMTIKLREKPFSVYLKYHKPHAGREVIFVDGENRNMLLAHETGLKGLVGTVSLNPQSDTAMEESRYPITMIGVGKMLEQIVAQWEEEKKYGEIDVKYYTDVKLGNVVCDVIESSHPQPRRQFKFQKTRLYLDKKTKLPVRVQQYGFPTRKGRKSPLVEQYTYSRLDTSVKLDDTDFDTRNPQYNY